LFLECKKWRLCSQKYLEIINCWFQLLIFNHQSCNFISFGLQKELSFIRHKLNRKGWVCCKKMIWDGQQSTQGLLGSHPGKTLWARHRHQASDFRCLQLALVPESGCLAQGSIQARPKSMQCSCSWLCRTLHWYIIITTTTKFFSLK
jgi:hypothetical protein